jgi:hypothetical protein
VGNEETRETKLETGRKRSVSSSVKVETQWKREAETKDRFLKALVSSVTDRDNGGGAQDICREG